MLNITVNNKNIEAEEGETILSACRRNGIRIPTLCEVKGLSPIGACRICMVEVEGMPNLVTSCSTLVSAGMKIKTNSQRVLDARKTIVELLISNHPDDCLYCAKSGDCELQDLAQELHITQRSYVSAPRKKPVIDDSAAFIRVDRSKCITCGRCVAVCNDVAVNEVLDFGWRGHNTAIVFNTNKAMGDSTCVQCGECVQACPVGALMEKKTFDLAHSRDTVETRTTCPYCGVGCQLTLHTIGERIVRITGVEDASPNKGRLCVKGRFGYDFIYSQDRLTTPLIREADGKFREAGWDEALDLVASRFKQIISESGPDAVAGVSCARSINEDSYQMQKLFRAVFGTNNIDHCART